MCWLDKIYDRTFLVQVGTRYGLAWDERHFCLWDTAYIA
jgi:hypothetical protein